MTTNMHKKLTIVHLHREISVLKPVLPQNKGDQINFITVLLFLFMP